MKVEYWKPEKTTDVSLQLQHLQGQAVVVPVPNEEQLPWEWEPAFIGCWEVECG